MAKSTSRPPRKPVPISSNIALEEPRADETAPEPELQAQSEPETPFDPPKPAPTKTATFLQRINQIEKADWGARANIYLYRIEPVIDRTRSGDPKFINVYAEPITEDRVMADYGSGRYKLMLNFRKPGAGQGDLLDSVFMDIDNMRYPPKIALGDWVDDPRNKKWAWCKEAMTPPAVPAAPAPAPDPLAHLNTFMDIQDRIEARIAPATTPAAAPAPVDPWGAAEKILNMRSDNPMVTILMNQITEMNKSAEAARQREFQAQEAARQREWDLQKELRQQSTAVAPAQSKGLIDQIVDAMGGENKADMLKRLFGGGSSEPAPSRRTTGLDLARELGGKLFDSPIAEGLGQWLGSLATRNVNGNGNGNGHELNPAPLNGNGAAPRPAESISKFIESVVNPALLSHYSRGLSGGDFAGWMADGYPDRLLQLQNFTHPMIPGKRGAGAIIAAYQNTPTMWPMLSSRGELAFTQFVEEFCTWTPEQEEEAIDVEHRDIEGPEAEEGPERI